MDNNLSYLIYENFGYFDSVRHINKKEFPVYLKFGFFAKIDYFILKNILPENITIKEIMFPNSNFDSYIYLLNKKNGKNERVVYGESLGKKISRRNRK